MTTTTLRSKRRTPSAQGAGLNRRSFLATGATGGSMVLGFHVPGLTPAAHAQAAGAEVNAWVVVKPDDTVVIRIARSEMGQGTLTGLAQLVEIGRASCRERG